MTSAAVSFDQFVATMNAQIGSVETLSSLGVFTILLTWARVFGFDRSIELTNFRKPAFLIYPFILLCTSIVARYSISSAFSGLYFELFTQKGSPGDTCISVIDNAAKYYACDYAWFVDPVAEAQLICALLGIVLLAVWYAVNVIKVVRERRHD